jgi:prophage DNA circulation protein
MQLFEARLDNFLLNILDISDTVDAAIATHEFMNTDGAQLDPQGLHAHTVKFRAYFFAHAINFATEYIDPTYANHFDFIESMTDNSRTHKLIHPKYGEIDGYCRSLTITHDDTQDYCAIDVDFIQDAIQTIGFISDQAAIDIAMNMQQIDLLNAQIDAMNSDLASMGMGSILGKAINGAQKLVDQFNNITGPVRDFLKTTDSFLNQCDTLLNTIEEPFNTITNAVNFVNDVPSRILGSINSCCNRIIGSLSALSNSPTTFMNNVTLGVVNLYQSLPTITTYDSWFKVKFLTISAGSVAWQTGLTFQTDENNRAVQKTQERRSSFDVKGRRINVAPITIVMSLNDIENALFNTRSLIQQAIVANRANNNDVKQLKVMAKELTEYTNSIKLSALTVKTVQISDMPMHVLVTSLGLNYNAAERVLQLNPQIKCPNFVSGNVKVYAS